MQILSNYISFESINLHLHIFRTRWWKLSERRLRSWPCWESGHKVQCLQFIQLIYHSLSFLSYYIESSHMRAPFTTKLSHFEFVLIIEMLGKIFPRDENIWAKVNNLSYIKVFFSNIDKQIWFELQEYFPIREYWKK